MQDLYLLTDYKGFFGSKITSVPYRSGMNISLIKQYFNDYNYEIKVLSFSDIDFRKMDFKDKYVLYTSYEDKEFLYKSYIEDIIYALQLQGAILIPDFKFLRANNNKVFMEIIRDLLPDKFVKNIKSNHFGTLEELKKKIHLFKGKYVIKSAGGSHSSGVLLGNGQKEIIKKSAKLSRSLQIYSELWDSGRAIKHKGYIKDSKHRNKFIIQNFVNNLTNDWKILIYGNKYYILYRKTRKNDFRASGSGNFIFKEEIPDGILDLAKNIYKSFNVPNLSIDVAFDGKEFYLIEFQAIFFGSTTIEKSNFYFKKVNNSWSIIKEKSQLEKEYVNSIINFIEKI